jgi:hypothetical protein
MAASFEDILQERTHKYRRSLMAICVVLIAIYWLPNLEFKDLALFGIKPKEAGYQARHLVLLALWILWLYHAILFWFYVQRDWKDWCSDLRAEGGHAFPEILMYFGRHPTEVTTRERVNDVEEWSWSLSTTRTNAEWIADYLSKGEGRAKAALFAIPLDRFRSVRSRIGWGYAVIDCGIPLFLSVVAIASACFAHFHSVKRFFS